MYGFHAIYCNDMRLDSNTYLATDYVALRRYLGEVRFNVLTAECSPARTIDMHDFSSTLPEQIARLAHAPPELCEIAILERALRDAIEAVEPIACSHTRQRVTLHPSVHLLKFSQNTVSIWSSLKCGETPPRPYRLETPQCVLVWRHDSQSRMRLLGEEEFTSLAAIRNGSDKPDPDYLRGWLDTGILTDAAKTGAAK